MLTNHDAWKLQHPPWYDGDDLDEIDGPPEWYEAPDGPTVRTVEPDEWDDLYETEDDIPF